MGTKLFEHGIDEETSDIRAHVSYGIVYVCKTECILEALKKNEYRQAPAFQPGYSDITAIGYLVPFTDIEDGRKLKYFSWPYWDYYQKNWSTARKGRWAVKCVTDLLKIGRFPLWLEAEQTQDKRIDIAGTDILLVMNLRIQVKCDFPARKTGNLYIQTQEYNPFKNY